MPTITFVQIGDAYIRVDQVAAVIPANEGELTGSTVVLTDGGGSINVPVTVDQVVEAIGQGMAIS